MADGTAQLEACKAAASKLQSQLDTAATKDEALDLAIAAAENLMKAMQLSSDQGEKKRLKLECASVMDVATRIKSKSVWNPLRPPAPPRKEGTTKSEMIGQWVADVAQSVQPSVVTLIGASRPADCSINGASNAGPAGDTHPAFDDISASSACDKVTQSTERRANDVSDPLAHSSRPQPPPLSVAPSDPAADGRLKSNKRSAAAEQLDNHLPPVRDSKSDPATNEPVVDPPRKISNQLSSPLKPSMAPYSQIRRLAEPVSTRRRSKKEEIILLKASLVSGSKCPPWDKPPATTEFTTGLGKFYTEMHDLSLSTYQMQFFKGWARAREAIPPPSLFPDREGVGPLMSTARAPDLVQDAATDCSVVASLCAGVARAERGFDQILSNKIYPFDANLGKPVISPNGKYIVRLNFNGCWRKVIIDDRLPLSNGHRLLHVIDRRQPALLWPALLEKAYLKVRGGYDFPGSNSCSDLWTLTGWIPEQIRLQENDIVPGQLWDRIYRAFLYGDVLVTLGTGKMSSRQERELGLEGQHSYVVLDMKETDHERLWLVKNPWVEGKGWRGPRPQPDLIPESSLSGSGTLTSVEAVPTKDRPHPTTFWIGLEQVTRHFESLYLNWNPGLFQYRQDIHFEWDISAHDAVKGCIIKHPQFSFWSKKGGYVWFLLTRHWRDSSDETKVESDAFNDGSIRPDTQMNSSGESSKGFMSVYVCNAGGQRIYMKDTYLESSDYVTTPQCLLRWEADAGSTYTVVIDQDELPRSLYSFSLAAFSNSDMVLEPAVQRYPFQKVTQGEWNRHTAGGNTSSSRYFENPQYVLEVRESGPLAILLTSAGHNNALHLKLTLGYGKRMYRLQNRDVLVDSGDHRSGCVLAETKDIQPGVYTLICSLFEAGQTGDYTLRVDSTSDIKLTPIPRDGAGLLVMKLAPACFGFEVQKVAAPLVLHRLASYTIVAHFSKARLAHSAGMRSMDIQPLASSPFRFSVELGTGPERKFLIASERGEYSDSTTIRCEPVSIDPDEFDGGELWLVLDRLCGPGGPTEEWYDVDIYTDVPKACSIGVWRNWNS